MSNRKIKTKKEIFVAEKKMSGKYKISGVSFCKLASIFSESFVLLLAEYRGNWNFAFYLPQFRHTWPNDLHRIWLQQTRILKNME